MSEEKDNLLKDNLLDMEQLEIEQMKMADDFQGLGKKVQELMRLPQSLCKMRGNCCRVATFKGTMSVEGLKALAQSDDPDAQNAQDFLTCFTPYETLEAVREVAPGFVERVAEQTPNPEEVGYFHCKFVAEDGRCLVHEDRPTGCRVYPFPHEKTIYHPGCGFEKKGIENWRKIEDITEFFDKRLEEISNQIDVVEEQVEE